jgi:hypothetical protein
MLYGCREQPDPLVDTAAWGARLQARGKDAIVAVSEWGMTPRMFGGGLLLTLSDFGLIPKMDVIPVKRFDAVWPAADSRPVTLQRLTLEDEFERRVEESDSMLKRFLRPTMLQAGSSLASVGTCLWEA